MVTTANSMLAAALSRSRIDSSFCLFGSSITFALSMTYRKGTGSGIGGVGFWLWANWHENASNIRQKTAFSLRLAKLRNIPALPAKNDNHFGRRSICPLAFDDAV